MAEYIEREAARPDIFCAGVSCQECPFLINPVKGGCKIDEYIKDLPAADVRPVVRGKWEVWNDDKNTFECSKCGMAYTLYEGTPKDNDYNYCPNCGAVTIGEIGERGVEG